MADEGSERDLRALVVAEVGRLEATEDRWVPYRLIDSAGVAVEAVASYFAQLQAKGSSASTVRSYGMDLLRWWRFLTAVGVPWNRATQAEARDFARWMQLADKPVREHWRRRGGGEPARLARSVSAGPQAGVPNQVTGKSAPGVKYAASTRAHCETVLRAFYDFHLEAGTGPIVNPFPLDRSRRQARAHAHHNPMDVFKPERTGRYRPRQPKRIPRRIPDEKFDEIFAGLRYDRDRALLVFWVSTGARAQELLDAGQGDVMPGQQLITVTRKGTRAVQQLPAAPDAFVWLRLYQERLWAAGVPRGNTEPLWWTLRRPWRPLNYPAARAMFQRANALLGANWTLHDLRHTAAYRLARDPGMPLTNVQWILGHRYLSTTQIYLNPDKDQVIASVLAHHARRAVRTESPAPPAPGYNPDSLTNLFGRLG